MPIDWERIEARRLSMFGHKGRGGLGLAEFERRLQEYAERSGEPLLTYAAYRNRYENSTGKRPSSTPRENRIYLDQVEAIAYAMEIPVIEMLDSSTRDEAYERGKRAGRREALGEIHTVVSMKIANARDGAE